MSSHSLLSGNFCISSCPLWRWYDTILAITGGRYSFNFFICMCCLTFCVFIVSLGFWYLCSNFIHSTVVFFRCLESMFIFKYLVMYKIEINFRICHFVYLSLHVCQFLVDKFMLYINCNMICLLILAWVSPNKRYTTWDMYAYVCVELFNSTIKVNCSTDLI